MVDIFGYTDFRKYLSDVYADRKRGNPAFSYRRLAQKAGLNSKGFVYNIVNGKKLLSKSNTFRLSEALGHNRPETEYFDNLVSFNQAKNLHERNHYFGLLCHIRTRGRGASSEPTRLVKEQFLFFSKWYHTIIRSLIGMYGFTGDYARLAKMVRPPILPSQARQSIALLEKLGLIEKDANNAWTVTDNSVTTGPEVASLAVENYHVEAAELAKRSIRETAPDMRNISGLILGISDTGYRRICEELREFQSRIMAIADDDDEADRVYHFNFHLFPVSETGGERGKK
ncbi:MAG: TIGR02147 family protein [Chitinispirillaceae bacterium]|nr:TIGR02147 family protein [Chitinispirillaceae bacterium]